MTFLFFTHLLLFEHGLCVDLTVNSSFWGAFRLRLPASCTAAAAHRFGAFWTQVWRECQSPMMPETPSVPLALSGHFGHCWTSKGAAEFLEPPCSDPALSCRRIKVSANPDSWFWEEWLEREADRVRLKSSLLTVDSSSSTSLNSSGVCDPVTLEREGLGTEQDRLVMLFWLSGRVSVAKKSSHFGGLHELFTSNSLFLVSLLLLLSSTMSPFPTSSSSSSSSSLDSVQST